MTKPIEPVAQSSFFTAFTIPAAPSFKAIENRFSSIKLPSSAQKVVLAALTLFALYAIYRAFQSLKDRVGKPEEDLPTAGQDIEKLNKPIERAEEKSSKLKKVIKNFKKGINFLHRPTKKQNDGYQSCSTILQVNQDSLPLKSFKQQIPGGHLTCRVKSGNMTLSDYLLQTLFRIHENPTCEDEGGGRFTLTYDKAKTFEFTKLPGETSLLKRVSLMSIAPKFKISKTIKVQIFKKEEATDLIFDPTALSLLENTLGYTGHLNILTIFGKAHPDPKKGHFLKLEVEHNIGKIKKVKTFDHQTLVDLLQLNIN